MAMVSMKQEREAYPEVADNPYGYGLCINLSEEQVEALGLKDYAPAAGSTVGLRAIALVTQKVEEADPDGDGDGIDVRLSLQITDLEVTPGGQGSSGASTVLYGNG